MTSRALINPLPKKSGVSLRATIQNPRLRKYASDADRQKAFRERQAVIQVRVKPETVETFDRIATTLGYSRQEVVYALLMSGLNNNRNWQQTGIPAFRLPRYEENPIMRKATPAQLAARERFAEMARSGAFKRKATKARSLSKKVDLQAWMDEYERLEQENMHSENVVRLADLLGTKTDQQIARQIVKNTQRIGYLDNDDYDRQRAIYKRLMPKLERLLKPKNNPLGVSGGRYEIRRLDKSNAIDSVYTTLTHAKSAIDEIDRPAGSFYIVDTETGKHYFSFQAETKYPHIEIRGTAMQKAYNRNPAEAKERKPRVVLITNPKERSATVYQVRYREPKYPYFQDWKAYGTFEKAKAEAERLAGTPRAIDWVIKVDSVKVQM